MANANYRKLPNGDWMNQALAGGPNYFQVQNDNDGLYYPFFTYDGGAQWFRFTPAGGGFGTAAAAQTALDAYVGQLNAGTA
jgi:hypothetical protein